MRIGINTFLFTSPFTNESTRWFSQFSDWGFDIVEIALEDPSNIDPVFVRAELDRSGLCCETVCAAMSSDRDLRGTPDQQQNALAYLRNLIDVMPTLGASQLVGPLYSAVGRSGQETEQAKVAQIDLVAGHLYQVAEYAQLKNIHLAIEPLNRFETDLINTTQQGLSLLKAINHPAIGLHLDTFHMNIEEKNLPGAIREAGPHLFHLHTCGSDPGTPGHDHTNWKGIADALRSINYSGSVVIESFTTDVKAIAKAAAIWRQIEPSNADIAHQGLVFLRSLLA